jgi:crotonobetainyl-CoA:carnitine CoA-transferase CaiB-like acyl-CoA transferase
MTGEPGRPPVKLGVPMADLGGGWYAVVGVLAALNERNRTGEGQSIDISMLDSLTSLHGYRGSLLSIFGNRSRAAWHQPSEQCSLPDIQDRRHLYRHRSPAGQILDGLCKALDISQEDHDKYATIKLRFDHREEVVALLESIFPTKAHPNGWNGSTPTASPAEP